jgi:AcrR family transcriptional regulator
VVNANAKSGKTRRASGASGPRSLELRTRFFLAAQEILAQEGYASLKQAALCQRLDVTTGSFYHSFRNWQEFTDAFLEHWREERTTLFVELARQESDPVRQLELFLGACLSLAHRAEAAIRIWASIDPAVAKVQQAVDDDRYGAVTEAMAPLVGKSEAERYASWSISLLVGFEQLAERQKRSDLEWSLNQVLEAVLRRAEERGSPGRASSRRNVGSSSE